MKEKGSLKERSVTGVNVNFGTKVNAKTKAFDNFPFGTREKVNILGDFHG